MELEPIRTRPTALTLAEAALMMRAAVKDKSYRATPVGLLVGRYLRWFRDEWGATATTIRDYEAILARIVAHTRRQGRPAIRSPSSANR